MTIKTELDIEQLKTRVATLEHKVGTAVHDTQEEVVTIAKSHWQAVIQRLEALEAKLRKKF